MKVWPIIRNSLGLISFKRLSASLHVKDAISASWNKSCAPFQTPFGITACERRAHHQCTRSDESFKRLSASLHVKARTAARTERPYTCFKRLSASLHVKESSSFSRSTSERSFKRLSASLHVKDYEHKFLIVRTRGFKRLSASLHVKVYYNTNSIETIVCLYQVV